MNQLNTDVSNQSRASFSSNSKRVNSFSPGSIPKSRMSTLQINEIHSLHNEALARSKRLQQEEFLLIEVLQRIDQKKVYRFFGYKSLFQYATIALKLSRDRAYTFIQVSRKALGLSKFQEALKEGLDLSKAKRICSVINKDNQEEWVSFAKKVGQKTLESAMRRLNPVLTVEEGFRSLDGNNFEFRAAVSSETEALMRRVQDLECQSKGRAVSYNEALKAMATVYLDKKDPVRHAQRVISKQIKKASLQAKATSNNGNGSQWSGFQKIDPQEISKFENNSMSEAQEISIFGNNSRSEIQEASKSKGGFKSETQEISKLEKNSMSHTQETSKFGSDSETKLPETSKSSHKKDSSQDERIRKPLSKQLLNKVHLRDQGKCQKRVPFNTEELDSSLTCDEGRWTDVHHIIPVHQGGLNILENLITLCRSHHQMEHDQDISSFNSEALMKSGEDKSDEQELGWDVH